jgi:hypothetical protein
MLWIRTNLACGAVPPSVNDGGCARMATEREILTRVRDDIREWVEGEHDAATMYYTLMLLEREVSTYLRSTPEPGIMDL